ncbi:MAG: IS110 family transposase [Chloroflexi bacterium]|nr:IS110 family transposase [Chloroflexota bacterium]
MPPFQYFVGLDLGAEKFSAAIGTAPWKLLVRATEFPNTPDGFEQLLAWWQKQNHPREQTLWCMEATGVYGEALAYFLGAHGHAVAVEPPLKVKRAFAPHGHKTDAVDSQQIAEYACRFQDEVKLWQPRSEILEQIKVLLTTREQITVQRTGHQNALHALKRKAVRTPIAEHIHEQVLTELRAHLQAIDAELRRLIEHEPPFQKLFALLLTIPGVGLQLAAHLLVLLYTTAQPLDAKRLAAFLGICPYERQSGSSVYATPTSRHYGPSAPRKLLHLAARSVSTHKPAFRDYYQRKLAEGKPKKVALNNVANKLLKIICAVVTTQTPYDADYRSVKALPASAT